MRIVFLPSAIEDLIWFKRYYERVFTAGALPARAAYARVLGLLRDNPLIGKPVQDRLGLREIAIPRTPFSFIYKVSPEKIFVVRVWDQRRDRRFD